MVGDFLGENKDFENRQPDLHRAAGAHMLLVSIPQLRHANSALTNFRLRMGISTYGFAYFYGR